MAPGDAVFAALADPTRRRLLTQLSADGPLSATELAPSYGMSRQAVVKHLATLVDAGLLVPARQGREVRYALTAGAMEPAADWMAEVGGRWERRLSALARQVAGQRPDPPRRTPPASG